MQDERKINFRPRMICVVNLKLQMFKTETQSKKNKVCVHLSNSDHTYPLSVLPAGIARYRLSATSGNSKVSSQCDQREQQGISSQCDQREQQRVSSQCDQREQQGIVSVPPAGTARYRLSATSENSKVSSQCGRIAVTEYTVSIIMVQTCTLYPRRK